MTGGEGEGTTLEYTPTWVVAGVCTVIVAISLAMERVLHFMGKRLKRKNQKPLFEALQKVKEGISIPLIPSQFLYNFFLRFFFFFIFVVEILAELMLLGFISLLLTVFQNVISKICVPEDLTRHMLPCKLHEAIEEGESTASTTCGKVGSTLNFKNFLFFFYKQLVNAIKWFDLLVSVVLFVLVLGSIYGNYNNNNGQLIHVTPKGKACKCDLSDL